MIEETGKEGGPTSPCSRSRIQSSSTLAHDRQGSPPAPRPRLDSAAASRRGIGSAAAGTPALECPAAPVAGLVRNSCLSAASRWAARSWGGFGIAASGALLGRAAGGKGRAGNRLEVGEKRGGCSRCCEGESADSLVGRDRLLSGLIERTNSWCIIG